jgi:hypothetical protein
MHKGYKCLDRSTGRIYISRDVVFDEKVFPFSTPGVVVDVSKLIHVSFPSTEPVTQSTDTRSYDITLLPVNAPSFVGSPVQVPSSASEQRPIDVQPAPPLHASGRVPDPTSHAATTPAPPLPARGAAPGSPPGALATAWAAASLLVARFVAWAATCHVARAAPCRVAFACTCRRLAGA